MVKVIGLTTITPLQAAQPDLSIDYCVLIVEYFSCVNR
jgi:hypothetical protein